MSPDEPFTYRADSTPSSTLRLLKRGHIAYERTVNLRGLTLDEAQDFLHDYIHNLPHSCCILVVHGQGLRSKDKHPVIKTYVQESLPKNPRVLAMSTAQPKDGGLGSMYVLISKKIIR